MTTIVDGEVMSTYQPMDPEAQLHPPPSKLQEADLGRTIKCEVDAGVFVDALLIDKKYLHARYTEQDARDDACSIAHALYQSHKPKTYYKASTVPNGPLIELTFWLLIAALVAVSGLWVRKWRRMR